MPLLASICAVAAARSPSSPIAVYTVRYSGIREPTSAGMGRPARAIRAQSPTAVMVTVCVAPSDRFSWASGGAGSAASWDRPATPGSGQLVPAAFLDVALHGLLPAATPAAPAA